MRFELAITGMTCAACASSIERTLRTCRGVTSATVYLADGRAEIEHDPEQVSPDHLVNLVEAQGYEATPTG